jgi:glycerol kinase
MAKCTYGTGSFLMMNTGPQRVTSNHGLLTTVAWQIGSEVHYALEGSVFVGGAVIQWLRDGLQLFEHASGSEQLAGSVADNGGVYFVPALTGLGAPHWDPHARGAIFGITRGTTKAHLARAALESICFQVDDVLQLFSAGSITPINQLRIDGGAAVNNMLAQFQADISAVDVVRPTNLETTALGVAFLAGIATGLWTIDELNQKWQIDQVFHQQMQPQQVKSLKRYWLKAVQKAKNWTE